MLITMALGSNVITVREANGQMLDHPKAAVAIQMNGETLDARVEVELDISIIRFARDIHDSSRTHSHSCAPESDKKMKSKEPPLNLNYVALAGVKLLPNGCNQTEHSSRTPGFVEKAILK